MKKWYEKENFIYIITRYNDSCIDNEEAEIWLPSGSLE